MSRDLPVAAAAAGLLAMSRWYARHARNPAGPVGQGATTALATWLAWFFIPALAIRYALGFGTRWLALTTAAALVVGAAIVALRGTDRPGALIALGGAGALAAGVTAMASGAIVPPYPEVRLLIAAGAATAVVIVGTRWMDRLSAEGGSGFGP